MTLSSLPASRLRVIIYCRISSDPEGVRAGVERQERDCRKRADRNGWDVVLVLVENDLSAYSGKPRPKYEQMLEMLRSGEADAVLALSPKRLYRQIKDAFEFFDLITERDIRVETINQGRFNLSTAEGRKDARRAAVDAQGESEEISERVLAAKADAVTRGLYRGGPRPFGFAANGVDIVEDEARWIRFATGAIISGESLRSICRTLAEQGVRTVPRRFRQEDGTKGEPTSREWKPEELRKMLLRGRNCGLLEVTVKEKDGSKRSEIAGKAAWEGIVSEEEWRTCVAILKDPSRRTTTGNGRVWLGSGLYRCFCGQTVRGSSTGVGGVRKAAEDGRTHRPAYGCDTPRHVIRDAPALDSYIERMVVARLLRPDAAELHLKPVPSAEPQADLDARMNLLRSKLDDHTEDYDADRITRKQFLDATAKTRARLNELAAKMAGRASSSVLASLPLGTSEMETVWPALHLDKKRAILDALCTVTINRARRGRPPGWKPPTDPNEHGSYFDASTISIDWKLPQ